MLKHGCACSGPGRFENSPYVAMVHTHKVFSETSLFEKTLFALRAYGLIDYLSWVKEVCIFLTGK